MPDDSIEQFSMNVSPEADVNKVFGVTLEKEENQNNCLNAADLGGVNLVFSSVVIRV